jgi:hypothetical protein
MPEKRQSWAHPSESMLSHNQTLSITPTCRWHPIDAPLIVPVHLFVELPKYDPGALNHPE